jgi:transposase
MQQDYLTSLLGIQGFRVAKVERIYSKRSHSTVRVHLERANEGYVCGGCGEWVGQGYDHTWQELHHLMLWHHHTVVRFPRFRVDCPYCGIRTEAFEFADIRGASGYSSPGRAHLGVVQGHDGEGGSNIPSPASADDQEY